MNNILLPPTILLLDVETSGLMRKDLSFDDPGQPWIMRVGAALCNTDGVILNHCSHLIKAEGRTVQEGANKVHGLTQRANSQMGLPEPRVLGVLTDMLRTAPFDEPLNIVTYGDFDFMVLASLFARFATSQRKPANTYDHLLLTRPHRTYWNLMTPVAQFHCALPSVFEDGGDPKYPSLDEACEMMLGMPPRPGQHDPWEDLLRTKALYFECRRLNYFQHQEQGVQP